MDYKAMGARIRAARREKRWTQAKLADEAGIATSFLGHIERGTRKASIETVVKLALVLNRSLSAIIAPETERYAGQEHIEPIRKVRTLLGRACEVLDGIK